MGLGYEGYVKVDGAWTLGTSASVPYARNRLDSSGGYGGTVGVAQKVGIGQSHTYDWPSWDGSVEIELTDGVFDKLKPWIITKRDSLKEIIVSSRSGNIQIFHDSVWNSISFSAAEGQVVTTSIGFVSFNRDNYTYGSDTYPKNGAGDILMCDLVPIPYWNTKIGSYNFLEWTLDFNQDVVKFFACNNNINPVEPVHYGVGPMTVTLSGTYLYGAGEMSDDPGNIIVAIGSKSFTLKRTELQDRSDNAQQGNTVIPIKVTIDAYELA